jgi:Kef-type K+ transport system membrane component KefB/nucleotide-binding universal stress UspA family protein
MHSISEHQIVIGLIILALVIALGRGAGDVARRLRQPEVLGQLFAGFLLGPSVFGALLPGVYHFLFSNAGVGTALSLFSWVGAILLLLMAGIEVDLGILRQEARPGAFAAAFAIIPSVVAGTIFARLAFGAASGFFLGIVLSVTGMTVIAKILMERGEMRRRFAQVILAAGITSELLVWLMVSVVSSSRQGSPLQAAAISSAYAIGFFLVMITVGRRFMFWVMRRVADLAPIADGQLSLVLLLTFAAAAITQALGLHALLGAFVVGVVLTQSPRADFRLRTSLSGLTSGLFAPIFFVLAGMRIDIFQLRSLSAIGTVLLLLLVANGVKIGLAALGARLGGLRTVEAGLVGVGLSFKGGTDVIVAIVGRELGLLTGAAFTMYAVVALLTVMVLPIFMRLLASHAPPSEAERERLEHEEGERRSYVPHLERVLVPLVPELLPTLAASVVQDIAVAKHQQGELMDIVELTVDRDESESKPSEETRERLNDVKSLDKVAVMRQDGKRSDNRLQAILSASKQDDLLAIGVRPPDSEPALSFDPLANALIHESKVDVLVSIDHEANHFDASRVKRILVPINGLEYSLAAGDIAGYLAAACDAELVVMSVIYSRPDSQPGDEMEQRLLNTGRGVTNELRFRLSRLKVRVSDRVVVGDDPAAAIVEEVRQGQYDVIVLGAVDRGNGDGTYFGKTVHTALTKCRIPALVLISHRFAEAAAA